MNNTPQNAVKNIKRARILQVTATAMGIVGLAVFVITLSNFWLLVAAWPLGLAIIFLAMVIGASAEYFRKKASNQLKSAGIPDEEYEHRRASYRRNYIILAVFLVVLAIVGYFTMFAGR